MRNKRTSFDLNPEKSKIELVIQSLNHVEDTIQTCYGYGVYPYSSSEFCDEEMTKLYYAINESLCKLYDRFRYYPENGDEEN